METKLPESVRLSAEATLSRYIEWDGTGPGDSMPVVVRALGDGSNNFSFLVANERRYVLRIDRLDSTDNALEPGAEHAALKRAAAAGLAPALRFADPELRATVCDYLPPDHRADPSPQALSALLRQIHALDPITYALPLAERIEHYRSRLLRRPESGRSHGVLQETETAVASARSLETLDRRPVLCHNDLLPPNCLSSGGRLWAIDWEYAAMGSRWFDLAVICAGHGFDHEQREALVRDYLGHAPSADENDLLHLASVSYRHLERLWYACHADE